MVDCGLKCSWGTGSPVVIRILKRPNVSTGNSGGTGVVPAEDGCQNSELVKRVLSVHEKKRQWNAEEVLIGNMDKAARMIRDAPSRYYPITVDPSAHAVCRLNTEFDRSTRLNLALHRSARNLQRVRHPPAGFQYTLFQLKPNGKYSMMSVDGEVRFLVFKLAYVRG